LSDDSRVQAEVRPGLSLASPWHTLIVLAVWGVNTYSSAIHAGASRAGMGPGRPGIYLRTMAFEIFLLAIVMIGVRLRGASLQNLFGKRWASVGQMFQDMGIGVVLLIVATAVVSILGGHQSGPGANRAIEFLLPQNSVEMVMWVALSITAAICEEAIYRGYFQGQFAALTGNVPAGIVISALLFGGAHLYQGVARAFVIFVSAILYGVVVRWRGTVRPGMFAHGIQDCVAPVLIRMLGR
jgi:membrane protease YdiL (CAAX protease family)